MREVFLGEYIRQKRLDAGLTQAQLCEGICEPVTISRLENGRQTPGRTIIKSILERLGLPGDRYFALLSDNEMEVRELQDEIRNILIHYRRASAESQLQIRANALKKLDELENIAEQKDTIIQQYILSMRANFSAPERADGYGEQLELLMRAIRLTVPRFDLEEINQRLYSIDETRIINQIALTYSKIGQRKQAISIFSQLLKYIEKHNKNLAEYAGHFCLVALNYAIELDLAQRYDEAIELAGKGRKTCLEYGHYQFMGSFIAVLAECHFFKGNITLSRHLYNQACYFYDAIGDDINLAVMRQEMKEHLNEEAPF